jgi:predicted ATPase
MNRCLVVISGCSGGGKSTLLKELSARGHAVFEEPGRWVVKDQLARGGDALPWADAVAFLELCVARGVEQWAEASRGSTGLCFFDRSIVDAFNGFEALGAAAPARFAQALEERRYHRQVFMTPPWPEIYATDAERRHTYTEAVQEFERLRRFYARQDYAVVMLPKIAPRERADFVLGRVG